mgnify:CR=1 FL=1
MAHFAEINDSNIVLQVLVVNDKDTQDGDGNEMESVGATYLHNLVGGTWKRTSYNTYIGVHQLGETPFRKNYAGTGYTYDTTRDAFIAPKPYPSWTLVEATCIWEAPVAYPDDDKLYNWNEETTSWDLVTNE